MILYTSMPYELIFPAEENSAKQTTLEIENGLLVVEAVSSTEYKVVRLISSDPQQYLNKNYQPGSIVSYKPQL